MLTVSESVKTAYQTDSTTKEYSIVFSSISLTLTNEQLVLGSFELEESLFSDENIRAGACEAAMVSFTVADVTQDLTGLEFTITQTISGESVAFGTFIVDSCKKQDNQRFKDIVAYDRLKKIDVDVADWYNSLTFPMTLSAFRTSFLAEVGLTENSLNLPLPNDSMSVNKTLDVETLDGRTVLEAIEEINGAFGHMNRNGEFVSIVLEIIGTTTDASVDISDKNVTFESYGTAGVGKIRIYAKDNKTYGTYGTTSNVYIIEDNFLVYDKTATELNTIAEATYQNVRVRPYKPYHSSDFIGLPYMEVGDSVTLVNGTTETKSYIFQRILRGIQSLKDTYEAQGTQTRPKQSGVSHQIASLRGSTGGGGGTVKIISNIVATKNTNGNITSMAATYTDDTSDTIAVSYNANDEITQVGDTIITYA